MAILTYLANQQTGLTEAWMWGVKEKNQEWFPFGGLSNWMGLPFLRWED